MLLCLASWLVQCQRPLWEQGVPEGRSQARVISTTAQLSNTLMCEISADRQLPGSGNKSILYKSFFFQSKMEQPLLLCERSEKKQLLIERQNLSRSYVTFNCWLT